MYVIQLYTCIIVHFIFLNVHYIFAYTLYIFPKKSMCTPSCNEYSARIFNFPKFELSSGFYVFSNTNSRYLTDHILRDSHSMIDTRIHYMTMRQLQYEFTKMRVYMDPFCISSQIFGGLALQAISIILYSIEKLYLQFIN